LGSRLPPARARTATGRSACRHRARALPTGRRALSFACRGFPRASLGHTSMLVASHPSPKHGILAQPVIPASCPTSIRTLSVGWIADCHNAKSFVLDSGARSIGINEITSRLVSRCFEPGRSPASFAQRDRRRGASCGRLVGVVGSHWGQVGPCLAEAIRAATPG
jgi:hypothetical protein